MLQRVTVRPARDTDLSAIQYIYNQGIEDRIATLDTEPKSAAEIASWWSEHDDRYAVLVATEDESVVAWASLNPFSHRCAHAAIADLSIYVERSHRGRGLGLLMMPMLEEQARKAAFQKIVLHTYNEIAKQLYRRCGYREVGVFEKHGIVDERYIDVTAMEKLLL